MQCLHHHNSDLDCINDIELTGKMAIVVNVVVCIATTASEMHRLQEMVKLYRDVIGISTTSMCSVCQC